MIVRGGLKDFLIAAAWATVAEVVVLTAAHLTTWIDRTDAYFSFGFVFAMLFYSRHPVWERR
jgi:hypothetical protein